jgi:hypothetical protein
MLKMRGVFGFICLAIILATPSLLVADVPLAQFLGQPKFSEGKALGYFLWKDGDTWKLRWVTFGSQHRFSGRIHLDGGAIQSMKRVDVDTERKLISPGRPGQVVRGPRGRIVGRVGGRAPVVASRDEDRIEQETEQLIRFFTLTDNDVDGLEFKVTDATERLRFVLEIDGKPRPAEVEVGKDNFKPNEHPLVVRLR